MADERHHPHRHSPGRGEPGPSRHAIGTGDFNGDRKADILFHNTTGQVAIWLMNGPPPPPHRFGETVPELARAGTGDFNGDGNSDILCQNTQPARLRSG